MTAALLSLAAAGARGPASAARSHGAAQPPSCRPARTGVSTIGLGADLPGRPRAARPGDATAILRVVEDVPMPGAPVRFDYQSEDSLTGRLYLSHMNDGHVVVIDTRTRRVTANIPDLPRVTGVWAVPELHKLYASATGRHRVAIIDLRTNEIRATAGPIGFPDGIASVPGLERVFVSDESGGGELVIDGATDRVVTTIPLGGEAGNTKYDPGSGCVLVAVQTRNEIVAIDPATAAVTARWRLSRGSHPHGMSVDAAGRTLFVANQGNATLSVVDLRSLEVTDIVPVGDDPDVLAFDPERRRLYVATEGGGLWVYRFDGRRLVVEGILDLPHAHTVSVDPATHLVYLPLQDVGGRPVLRILRGVAPAHPTTP